VPHRNVTVEIHGSAGRVAIDRNRLDPVNGVLEAQVRARRLGDIHRRPRIGGFGTDVEEQRPLGGKRAARGLDPVGRPCQVVFPRPRIVVAPVPHSEVVRRGGHDYGNGGVAERREHVEAVSEIKTERPTAGFNNGVWRWKPGRLPQSGHRASV
jgi:hypothetical protein